jgi:hypothetical protein
LIRDGIIQVSDFQFTATWFDLGCPTTPGPVLYEGKRITIKPRDIERAQGNPDTVFRVLALAGQYVLGAIEDE